MAKKTYDITHRVTRILASDYAFLAQLSLEYGIPMAEVLHAILTGREVAPKPTIISKAQMEIPAIAYHLPPTTTKIAVNGSKPAAFGTKLRRVKYE
jgi:hypothetical protein